MKISLLIVILVLLSGSVVARDAARDLSRMVGYTIIDADSVSEVITKDYSDKYLKLYNGSVFKVDFLLLDPLVMTDVIVFAKKLPASIINKYKGKLPERMLFSYKLLIDNEVFDATAE